MQVQLLHLLQLLFLIGLIIILLSYSKQLTFLEARKEVIQQKHWRSTISYMVGPRFSQKISTTRPIVAVSFPGPKDYLPFLKFSVFNQGLSQGFGKSWLIFLDFKASFFYLVPNSSLCYQLFRIFKVLRGPPYSIGGPTHFWQKGLELLFFLAIFFTRGLNFPKIFP